VFAAARDVLLYISSSSCSNSNALLSIQRLFTAFNTRRVALLQNSAKTLASIGCDSVAHASASAAVGCFNEELSDVPAVAHATLLALRAALQPPSAAALALRTILQKSVKSLKQMKKQYLRPPASPSRSSHAVAEARGSSVAHAVKTQVCEVCSSTSRPETLSILMICRVLFGRLPNIRLSLRLIYLCSYATYIYDIWYTCVLDIISQQH